MSNSNQCPYCATEIRANAIICTGCQAEYISHKELLNKKLLRIWGIVIFIMILPLILYLFGREDENSMWLAAIVGLLIFGGFLSWIASVTTSKTGVWRRTTLK